MRQHLFRGKGGRWDIRVGWTDALESFFAVVWDVNDRDDSPVFTAGSSQPRRSTPSKNSRDPGAVRTDPRRQGRDAQGGPGQRRTAHPCWRRLIGEGLIVES